MNEVTIPLKLTGIAQIKAELKSLKDQILNATDPAQMAELADKAGELQKRLNSVNSQISEFKKGSNLDQVKNSFDGLAMSIADMDFTKASKESANLNQTIKALKPEDLTKQFKGFTSTIGNLGKSFLSLGKVMLSNPIFLIATIITVVVVAIGVWLKSMGKLEGVLKSLFKPIQYLIDKFNEFTDSLGLTSHEAEANAEKIGKANEKVTESSKKRSEKISSAYDLEIAVAKANGKETIDLEIAKSRALEKESKTRLTSSRAELRALQKVASEDNKEKRTKLREQISAEQLIMRNGANERKLLTIQYNADVAEQEKEDAKVRAEKAKEYAKNRQDASRTIKDIEISLIKDDSEREIATTNEKYKRLAEDAKKNANLTNAERITLMKLYEVQRIDELNKASQKVLETEVANAKKIAEGIKAFNEAEALNKENIEEVNYQAGLTAREKERQDLQYHYDDLLAQAERYGVDSTNIEAEFALKKAEMDKKNLEEDTRLKLESIEKAKNERDAKIAFAGDIANGITAIGGMLIKDQKKLEKFNKASALVQIGIDTAKAISSLVAMSQSNPLNAVTAGGAGIAQFASGIVQIITNVAKAKSLLSNPSSTPSGGGGGGGGGGSESSTSVSQATPAIQMFGQGNNLNTAGGNNSVNANQNMTVTAVVSESDITSTQTKLFKLQKNAEL
jgi:hypothetical protein